jgi:hypothetical protein
MIYISLHTKRDRLKKWHDAFVRAIGKFRLGGMLTLQEAMAKQTLSLVLNLTDSLKDPDANYSLGQLVVQTRRVKEGGGSGDSVIEVSIFATNDNMTFYRLSTEFHPEGEKSPQKNIALHENRLLNQIMYTLQKLANGVLLPLEEHCAACSEVALSPGLPGMSLGRRVIRKVTRIRQNFFLERWHCALLPFSVVNESAFGRIKDIQPIWLPLCDHREDFKADSFGAYRNGYYYFFYEYYNAALHKGEIRYEKIAVHANAITALGQGLALRLEEHLSYPFLFEDQGQTYMLPECHQSGGIQLYKAVEFPSQWEHCKTLIPDFKGVDSSIFSYGGMWWIFCTSADADSNLRLFIWYAEDLFGPWKAHRLNPVKADIRSSRPGGIPFVLDGQLYRPAQDSSRTYGGGLVINKVIDLTTASFEEIPVCTLSGYSPFGKGIHTFSGCRDVIFVDGKDYILKPKYLWPWKRGR